MSKKPIGINFSRNNEFSTSEIDDSVISVSNARRFTDIEPANYQKEYYESPDTGGSKFHGLRLLKSGEYAGKRTWKAVIESGHLALIGNTEKVGSKWIGISFSGKTYIGKTRDEVCGLMTEEFLVAVGADL